LYPPTEGVTSGKSFGTGGGLASAPDDDAWPDEDASPLLDAPEEDAPPPEPLAFEPESESDEPQAMAATIADAATAVTKVKRMVVTSRTSESRPVVLRDTSCVAMRRETDLVRTRGSTVQSRRQVVANVRRARVRATCASAGCDCS
jgi:hypothetical protein